MTEEGLTVWTNTPENLIRVNLIVVVEVDRGLWPARPWRRLLLACATSGGRCRTTLGCAWRPVPAPRGRQQLLASGYAGDTAGGCRHPLVVVVTLQTDGAVTLNTGCAVLFQQGYQGLQHISKRCPDANMGNNFQAMAGLCRSKTAHD